MVNTQNNSPSDCSQNPDASPLAPPLDAAAFDPASIPVTVHAFRILRADMPFAEAAAATRISEHAERIAMQRMPHGRRATPQPPQAPINFMDPIIQAEIDRRGGHGPTAESQEEETYVPGRRHPRVRG